MSSTVYNYVVVHSVDCSLGDKNGDTDDDDDDDDMKRRGEGGGEMTMMRKCVLMFVQAGTCIFQLFCLPQLNHNIISTLA